jgi:hypothetical protein
MSVEFAPGARADVAWRLSWVVVFLMVLQAAMGLAFPQVYRDIAWIKATWFANDLVTLVVAAPMLAASLIFVRRGSSRAQLLWLGMLAFSVYNYAFYLTGASLNGFFPLFVAVEVISAIALILALAHVDAEEFATRFSQRTPVRSVAAYLGFTGVGLMVGWLAQWGAYIFAGAEPSAGVEAFAVVAALDLTMVVPLALISSVLLWRRRPWGYVLAAISAIKGATYTLVLTVSSIYGASVGTQGAAAQIPVWGVWTACGLAVAAVLLLSLPAANGAETPERATSDGATAV